MSYLYVVVVMVRFHISVSSSGFDAAISCGNKLRIQITKKGVKLMTGINRWARHKMV